MPRRSRSRSPTRYDQYECKRYEVKLRRNYIRGFPDERSERYKAGRYERRRYDNDREDDYRRSSSTRGYECNRSQETRYGRDGDRLDEYERTRERERSLYRDRGDSIPSSSGLRARESGHGESEEYRAPSVRSSARPRSQSPVPSRPGSIRSKSPTDEKEKNKGKPNFNLSGLLAAETNAVRLADGTSSVLKYNEPPEARKPTLGWRLYVFEGTEQTDLFHINRQSCYLFGRDKAIVDIFLEHPLCSKQHAVIQHRQVQKKDEYGSTKAFIKPFIIDLESTHSTFVNDEPIPTARYYELQTGDVIKFGRSTREYVLLHDEAS